MNAREEKRAAFNEQMNAWVSRQGLWFQLRHAADGQSLVARLSRIAIRLGILLLIVLVVGWFYLTKRVEWSSFHSNVEESLQGNLNAESINVGSIKKSRDLLVIAKIDAVGGENAFFSKLKARVVRLDMGVTNGVFTQWDAGNISAESLQLTINAGASNDEKAAAMFDSVFKGTGDLKFDLIESNSTNVKWGYTESSFGEIRDSHMSAAKSGDSWRLDFTGGYFTQNWLKNLPIKRLSCLVDKSGVTVERAEFAVGDGVVTFSGKFGSGGQPEFAGELNIESVPVSGILPAIYHDWVSGSISATGRIGGSTNTQEGVVTDLKVTLKEGDHLILRDNFPVLSALTVVDLYNSYRKVTLNEGSFSLKTVNGVLSVTDINLKAGDLFYLAGDVNTRPPSNKEIGVALGLEEEVVEELLETAWKFNDEPEALKNKELSLDGASKKNVEKKMSPQEKKEEERRKTMVMSIRAEKSEKRFGGTLRMGLQPDVFDKSPALKKIYPLDEKSNRIWVNVPLIGRLQSLSLDTAKQMYLSKERSQ